MEPKMTCTIINNTILKPSSFSSTQFILNSLVPFTIFDEIALDVHVAMLHAFKPPMPSNEILKNALAKVLIHFPHLAGRLTMDEGGHQCILLNNAGIRLIETYVPTTLVDQMKSFESSSNDVSHLHPPTEGIDEILQVQLNRYTCGGVVIGSTGHHRVADGYSWNYFYISWSRLVRGLEIDPLPYHNRCAIMIPRKEPRVEFDHRSNEFQLSTTTPGSQHVFYPIEKLFTHFPTDFINKVKAKVTEENFTTPNQRYSTFECLLTHVWKKVIQARGMNLNQFSQITVGVNGRGRIKPPVPMEYFGNLVLDAFPKLKAREVITENYGYVAKTIHDAISNIDSNYFQSFADFKELCKRNGEKLKKSMPAVGNILCPNIEADNWLRFNFHDLDFGGGPCAFFYPNVPVEGVLIFLPSNKEGGGIDVFTALMSEHLRETEEQNKMIQGTTILAMNGGDGPYSYAKNSTYQ
ncbi:Tryptamine hydroxycinnamoyltransferase, partial [Thalictrum thalictroides]